MTPLELKIYAIVRQIPAGKVATYGQIAALAGDAHLARFVGNVMHKNPAPFIELARQAGFRDGSAVQADPAALSGLAAQKERTALSGQSAQEDPAALSRPTAASADFEPVPCHRVVASSGRMGANFGLGGPAIQAAMLRLEGVEVTDGRVDLVYFAFTAISSI